MNAKLRLTETNGERQLRELRERQAAAAAEEFAAAEKTGFLKVGNGQAVHLSSGPNGDHTVCGAEGVGSAQVRFQIAPLKIVAGPATCKRCLKQRPLPF